MLKKETHPGDINHIPQSPFLVLFLFSLLFSFLRDKSGTFVQSFTQLDHPFPFPPTWPTFPCQQQKKNLIILHLHIATIMALNMTFDPPPTHEHPAHQSHSRRFPSFSSSSQHGQSPPAYSTNTEDILSAKYQRWSKLLNAIRIVTAAIMLIIAVPIIGTTGNSLKAYQSTNLGGKMYLPLWPANVDLRPTHSILACGVVVTTWSLIYLIASFFPSVRIPSFPPPLGLFTNNHTSLAQNFTSSTSSPPPSAAQPYSSPSSPQCLYP